MLESLFTLLSAIEANLLEFKQVKDQLSQIVSDIKSLTNVDELSDDHVFEFSTMATARHGDSISQASNRDPFVPVRTQAQPFRRHSLVGVSVGVVIAFEFTVSHLVGVGKLWVELEIFGVLVTRRYGVKVQTELWDLSV